jgi:amino acid transporter
MVWGSNPLRLAWVVEALAELLVSVFLQRKGVRASTKSITSIIVFLELVSPVSREIDLVLLY